MKTSIILLLTGVVLTTIFSFLRIVGEGGFEYLIGISCGLTIASGAVLAYLLISKNKAKA